MVEQLGGFLIYLLDAVLQLTIEEIWQLSVMSYMKHIRRNSYSHHLNVFAHVEWFNDGAWSNEDERACLNLEFLQIEDAVNVTLLYDAQAVVIQKIRTTFQIDEWLKKAVDVDDNGKTILEVKLIRLHIGRNKRRIHAT